MKKKFLSAVLVIAMTLSMSISCFAQEVNIDQKVNVVLNGEQIEFADQKPVISGDDVLVPLRAVLEKAGGIVFWSEDTKTIIVSLGELKIITQIDNTKLFVNDKQFELDVAPTIINGRTMVSSNTIKEALNAKVELTADKQTVSITTETK